MSQRRKRCLKVINKCDNKSELKEHESAHAARIGSVCEKRAEISPTNNRLENHMKGLHGDKSLCKGGRCDKKFPAAERPSQHTEEGHRCTKCDQSFSQEEDLNVHMVTFHAENVFNCQKCNKPYESMTLLRRHDWRSHREIECNMCGESLESRMDIKNHRETKHRMYQKVYCKFFPACIDGSECLFEHALESGEASHCPNGQMCIDQTCKFSEQRHIKSNNLCMFQTNCNRLHCPYTHTATRKAFLGEGSVGILRN